MCTLGDHQCKTVPIPGLRVFSTSPNQTWTFLYDITIKVPKFHNGISVKFESLQKYEIKVYTFSRFTVFSNNILNSCTILCADNVSLSQIFPPLLKEHLYR